MRIAWIALGLMVVSAAWSESNPPAPTKSEHAREEQSHTHDCSHISDSHCADSRQPAPAITVNVTPSPQWNENTPSNKNNNPPPEKGGWSIHDPNSIIAFFTIVLAGVGFAQVRAALLQWKTYRAQTEIFTAQNRAFVFLEKLQWEPMATDNDGRDTEWRVIAVLKNSGSTPARNLLVDIQSIGFVDQLAGVFSFSPNYGAAKKMFIGPQASISIDGPKFDVGDIERRGSEDKRHLLIWGWMEYEDIFPSTERHRTEFCMELSADLVVDLEANTHRHMPRFIMYPAHNGAEGECMHRPRPRQI
jgi:hypothetical protein